MQPWKMEREKFSLPFTSHIYTIMSSASLTKSWTPPKYNSLPTFHFDIESLFTFMITTQIMIVFRSILHSSLCLPPVADSDAGHICLQSSNHPPESSTDSITEREFGNQKRFTYSSFLSVLTTSITVALQKKHLWQFWRCLVMQP